MPRRRAALLRLPRATAASLGVLAFLAPALARAESFAEASSRGLGPALLFALTAGLLTALTPCVYPMIPVTVSIFGAKTGVSRGRAVGLASFYVAGIAVMFGGLGTTFALLGRAFGTFLANPWVVVPICLLFVAMALSLFGAFELSLPLGVQERLSRVGGRGFAGAFLMGLVGGIIAAPCTGPPLAGILAYVATSRDAGLGFVLLATYAVGIGAPFWAIAAFSMSLPRSGPWMENVKSILAIPMLVAALYFLKNVVPSLWKLTGTSPTFLAMCIGAVVVGLAIGAIHLSFHDAWPKRIRKGLGVALVTLGLFATTNYVLTPKTELAWLASETQALEVAKKSGKPLLVDFGANWCLPCKELEAHVFSAPAVAAVLTDRFVLLKVKCDNEDDDPSIKALRDKYQATTLPAVRLVSTDGQITGRVDSVVSVDEFLKFLSRS